MKVYSHSPCVWGVVTAHCLWSSASCHHPSSGFEILPVVLRGQAVSLARVKNLAGHALMCEEYVIVTVLLVFHHWQQAKVGDVC